MTKAELVHNVARVAQVTKKEADAAVSEVFDSIKAALLNGDKVPVAGFGTFSVRETKARPGRNPQTGESLVIKAGKKIAFKLAKELKESLK